MSEYHTLIARVIGRRWRLPPGTEQVAADDIIAALSEAGFAIVAEALFPKEPTKAMVEAMARAICSPNDLQDQVVEHMGDMFLPYWMNFTDAARRALAAQRRFMGLE